MTQTTEGLTERDYKILTAAFLAEELGTKEKYAYVKRSAIHRRLRLVDPNWKLHVETLVQVVGDTVTVWGSITLKGVTRWNSSSKMVNAWASKEKGGARVSEADYARELQNAQLKAATALIFRCAESFEIGLYLKEKREAHSLVSVLKPQTETPVTTETTTGTPPPAPAVTPPASDKIVTLPPQESTEDPTPPLSGEKAKEALNQSSTPSRLGIATWATEDSLKEMYGFLREKMNMHDVSDAEFAKSVGLEVYTADAWNRAYYERKLAVVAIRDAINKQLAETPKATPKWTADEIVIMEKWLKDKFDMTPELALGSMSVVKWQEFDNLFKAQESIIDHALRSEWVFLADSAVYDGKEIVFQAVVPVREFSRKKVAEMVGEGYAAANGITTWEARKQPYELKPPVAIVWKRNDGKNGVYYTPTAIRPLEQTEQSPVEADLADVPF